MIDRDRECRTHIKIAASSRGRHRKRANIEAKPAHTNLQQNSCLLGSSNINHADRESVNV